MEIISVHDNTILLKASDNNFIFVDLNDIFFPSNLRVGVRIDGNLDATDIQQNSSYAQEIRLFLMKRLTDYLLTDYFEDN